MKNFKLHRLIVFLLATIALANFFEAGRLISNEMTFAHVSTSIFSLLLFIFSLFLLGYWIYADEKEKNNLRIKFGIYEWLYKKFTNNVIAREQSDRSNLQNVIRLLRQSFRLPRNDVRGIQK